MDNYRIRRCDSRNIVIEKLRDEKWHIISYHGNSPKSLISGLFEVMMAQHTPTGDNLPEQLATLELELVSGVAKIEKMVEEAAEHYA